MKTFVICQLPTGGFITIPGEANELRIASGEEMAGAEIAITLGHNIWDTHSLHALVNEFFQKKLSSPPTIDNPPTID